MNPTNSRRKSLALAGLLVVMFALSAMLASGHAYAKADTGLPVERGKLAVQVNNNTLGPLAIKAKVTVVDAFGNIVANGMANASGYFTAVLMPGKYKLAVRANGYETFITRVAIVGGKITQLNATLQPLTPTLAGAPGADAQ